MGQAQNIKWDACIKIQGVNNSEGEGWQGKEKEVKRITQSWGCVETWLKCITSNNNLMRRMSGYLSKHGVVFSKILQ